MDSIADDESAEEPTPDDGAVGAGAPNAQNLQQPVGPAEPEAWKGMIPDDRYREYKDRRAALLTVSSNPVNLAQDVEELLIG